MTDPHDCCNDLVDPNYPDLKRLNYCHGQMLTAQDFVDEQAYYLNKIALLTRCIAGYGVVCGLSASIKQANGSFSLVVSPGVAVDPLGRELVKRAEETCDLYAESFLDQQPEGLKSQAKSDKKFHAYLTIEYCAVPIDRAKQPHGACCDKPVEFPTRWSESPLLRLTFDPPPDQNCCACCHSHPGSDNSNGKVEHPLWLARLEFPSDKSQPPVIENRIRRPFTRYQPTRVESVNWVHNGLYQERVGEVLLRNDLIIDLTASINPDSIKRHSVEFESQDRKEDECTSINDIVEISLHSINRYPELLGADLSVEDSKTLKNGRLRIKLHKDSKNHLGLRPQQRVFIRLRSDFILDECCQPLDGNHIGGDVPLTSEGWPPWPEAKDIEYFGQSPEVVRQSYEATLRDSEAKRQQFPLCAIRDASRFPASGNDVPGGDFLSWFNIVSDK
jgi:hypothetical protein